MATLMIQLPGLPPVSHVLKEETITIGRMKGNNIVLDDASVSLTHARITRHGGEFYLKDLNSTNGTVVNGQRINEARLRNLDKISFADIAAQFQMEAAEAAAQAPTVISPSTVSNSRQPAPVPIHASQAAGRPPATAVPAASRPVFEPEPERDKAFDFTRFISRVVGVLGGAVALCVVSFLVWKMAHGGFDADRQQTAAQKSEVAAAAAAPVVAEPEKKNNAVAANPSAQPAPQKTSAPATAPAISGAATHGGPETVAQLALTLRDPDPVERRKAATTLHSLGAQAKEAEAALHAALDDTDQDVRMWAALTLVNNELHDKATIPILIGVLQRENPVLRQVACLSLGLIPYEDYEKSTVVPALTETANKDGDDEVRKAAVSALNIIAPDAAAKVIIK